MTDRRNFTDVWGEGLTNSIDIDSPLSIPNGWLIGKPERNYANWVENRQDAMLRHIEQNGLPRWDAGTIYANGALCLGSDNNIYQANKETPSGDPITSADWDLFEAGGGGGSTMDPDDYYTKLEVDGIIDNLDVYTKGEVDLLIEGISFDGLTTVATDTSIGGDGTTGSPLNTTSTIIPYDNTDSGLTATTVKTAIDEVVEMVESISGGGGGGASSADEVSYDNSGSGLVATNVQDAIDELDTALDEFDLTDYYTKAQVNGLLDDLFTSGEEKVDLTSTFGNSNQINFASTSDGDIYGVSPNTGVMKKSAGSSTWETHIAGTAAWWDIACDANDRIYVSATNTQSVKYFDPSDTVLSDTNWDSTSNKRQMFVTNDGNIALMINASNARVYTSATDTGSNYGPYDYIAGCENSNGDSFIGKYNTNISYRPSGGSYAAISNTSKQWNRLICGKDDTIYGLSTAGLYIITTEGMTLVDGTSDWNINGGSVLKNGDIYISYWNATDGYKVYVIGGNPLQIEKGGTGATTEAGARANLDVYSKSEVDSLIEGISGGGGGASSADEVSYDNAASGLTATNVQDAIDELNNTIDGLEGGSGGEIDVGVIVNWSGNLDNIPAGYLHCNGSDVSRTGYNSLFNVIGTTYGAGDGSTTFGLPNDTFANLLSTGNGNANWVGMAAAPNGDIYVNIVNAGMYVSTNRGSSFVDLGQTHREWQYMTAAPNGNIYAAVFNGDIYMRTAGSGNFNGLGQTSRGWRGVAAAPNGDVYASVANGDIYLQSEGTGTFNALSQTSRDWVDMCVSPNGDVYACVGGGDIYIRAGGAGDFVALGQTSRVWTGMSAAPNGDIYASVNGGDMYVRRGGTGDFVAMNQRPRQYIGNCVDVDGNLLVVAFGGDIYRKNFEKYDIIKATTASTASVVKTGMSLFWDGALDDIPNGYLFCDGSEVSRTVYPDLFSVIGTRYGRGDGSTTFNLPYDETSIFQEISSIERAYNSIASTPNGDIYITVANGDIYMKPSNGSDFAGLSQTTRNWVGITGASNGDVYASVNNGDIYVRAGGTGSFTALSQTSRAWTGMAAAPNGDIYAAVFGGDIYIRAGGTGNFTALSQTSRNWYGMAAAPNGDVYACDVEGQIYKRAGGAGDFISMGFPTRVYYGVCVAPNGDLYAVVQGGTIFLLREGKSSLESLYQKPNNWRAICAAPNGHIYASIQSKTIWLLKTSTYKIIKA